MPLVFVFILVFLHLVFCVFVCVYCTPYIQESMEHSNEEKNTMDRVRMAKLFVEMFAAYMISCMKAGSLCVRHTEKKQMK